MKVRGNWYAEEFGGGSKHELRDSVHALYDYVCLDTLPCFQLL